MPRHHTIITGVGRSGTTFLVQLVGELGLDIGGPGAGDRIDPYSNAGLERDLRDPEAPYIVKSPHLSNQLRPLLASGDVAIDHAIVPMRDLFAAAESRRRVEALHTGAVAATSRPGGLWGTAHPAEQEAFLTLQIYELMDTLATYSVPITLLHFPRLARDADYLFDRLLRVFPDLDRHRFDEAFTALAQPRLIHDFDPESDETKQRSQVLVERRNHQMMEQQRLKDRVSTLTEKQRRLKGRIAKLTEKHAEADARARRAEHRADVAEARLADVLDSAAGPQAEALTRPLRRAASRLRRGRGD